MDWQPIETAPLDVPILGFCPSGPAVIEGHDYQGGTISWWVENSHGFNEDGQVLDVTHWMPLPDPPKESE